MAPGLPSRFRSAQQSLSDSQVSRYAPQVPYARPGFAYVYSVAFSPDGGCLASGSGDATGLWDTGPMKAR